jgi:hypothetical protein
VFSLRIKKSTLKLLSLRIKRILLLNKLKENKAEFRSRIRV